LRFKVTTFTRRVPVPSAAKYQEREVDMPSIERLLTCSEMPYSRHQLECLEMNLLKAMDWNLTTVGILPDPPGFVVHVPGLSPHPPLAPTHPLGVFFGVSWGQKVIPWPAV
jgi:hypothetical protein